MVPSSLDHLFVRLPSLCLGACLPFTRLSKDYSAVHSVVCAGDNRLLLILAEELGTMSKNNLRGITLDRSPMWGIHSLTLIISRHTQIDSQLKRSLKESTKCL